MTLAPLSALVVTSIQAPNAIMRNLARAAVAVGAPFVVIGDRKSPANYDLPGADFLSLSAQHERFGRFSHALPEGHYARKNLGYLAALATGAAWIVETDDDNDPLPGFMEAPPTKMHVRVATEERPWINAYRYFSPSIPVWPRGLPLELLGDLDAVPPPTREDVETPVIVQGLADDNPDVDAVYRLTRPLPVRFGGDRPLALDAGQWCPFNSQNTWFHRDVAALLYLPSHCSFRMTDIWRSFVAQRCLWAMGGRIVFVAPTVRQDRNEHNLLRDFADEIPGYLNNDRIRRALAGVPVAGSPTDDLIRCYEALVAEAFLPADELGLVSAWVEALAGTTARPAPQ